MHNRGAPLPVQILARKVTTITDEGREPHQWQENFLNLEWEKDQDRHRKGSVLTTHISKSRSRVRSHVSQRQDNNKALQWEIDDLKKKLRCAQQRHSPSNSDTSKEGDDDYRRRSRTPPSETFSYEDEYNHRCRHKSPSRKGLVNHAMSKALDRISKSPFTHKIEGVELLRRFHQPTFTMYNGRTDPVENVSQFN